MKSKLLFGILTIGGAMFNPAYAADLVSGQTLADSQLQRDVIASPGFAVLLSGPTNLVMMAPQGNCRKADKIVATLIEPPADRTASSSGKLLKAKWRELWTATACGREVPVYVSFSADGHGGTDFAISAKNRLQLSRNPAYKF